MKKSISRADRLAGLFAFFLARFFIHPVFAQNREGNLELTITVQHRQWMPGEVFKMKAILENTGSKTLAVDISGDLGTSYYLKDAGSKVYSFKMWANYGVPCDEKAPRLKAFSPDDFVLIKPGESYTKILHCKVSAGRLKSINSITYKENHVRYFTSWIISEKFVDQGKKAFPNAEVFRTAKTLTSNMLPIRVGK